MIKLKVVGDESNVTLGHTKDGKPLTKIAVVQEIKDDGSAGKIYADCSIWGDKVDFVHQALKENDGIFEAENIEEKTFPNGGKVYNIYLEKFSGTGAKNRKGGSYGYKGSWLTEEALDEFAADRADAAVKFYREALGKDTPVESLIPCVAGFVQESMRMMERNVVFKKNFEPKFRQGGGGDGDDAKFLEPDKDKAEEIRKRIESTTERKDLIALQSEIDALDDALKDLKNELFDAVMKKLAGK